MDVIEDLVEGVDLFRNKRHVLRNIRLYNVVLLDVELALSDGVDGDSKLMQLASDFFSSVFDFLNFLLDLFYLVWVTLLECQVRLHLFELAADELSEFVVNEPFQIFFGERPIVIIDVTDENPFEIFHYVHDIPVNVIIYCALGSGLIFRFDRFVQQTEDLGALISLSGTRFGIHGVYLVISGRC